MSRFRVNTYGVNAIKRSPGTRSFALRQARAVAQQARRTAPVRTGHYRDSIKAIAVVDPKDGGWLGRVNAYDFKAVWVELGTNGIRKSRVLGTALDAASSDASIGWKR